MENAKLYIKNIDKQNIYYPDLEKLYGYISSFCNSGKKRNQLKKYLLDNKIEDKYPLSYSIHKQNFFIKKFKNLSLPNTESQAKRF